MGAQAVRVLAIVAKYPLPGTVKTRLAATIGAAQAAELYRAFLRDLAARFTQAAQRDGYSLVWAHTPGPGDLGEIVGGSARLLRQRGSDFAERLHNVSADLGATGYRRVVVISSDSPHLPAAWVRAAFTALDRSPVVLGPAEDGGYYLVGVRAEPAPPDLFRGIQMSTPRVFAETLARSAELGISPELLPATFDVDEAADLRQLARALACGHPAAASPHTRAALRRLGIDGGAPAVDSVAAG